MSHKNLIVEYSKKWEILGIKSAAIKVEREHGSKKLFKKVTKLSAEILENQDLQEDFNFLAIFLKDSGIFCLDVEGLPGSIKQFYKFLEERGVDHRSLMMETSLNGGIHAYFRTGMLSLKTQHFKDLNGIKYDLLFDGRAFTCPSSFGGKKYEWQGQLFHRISSKDEIPEFPTVLSQLLDK